MKRMRRRHGPRAMGGRLCAGNILERTGSFLPSRPPALRKSAGGSRSRGREEEERKRKGGPFKCVKYVKVLRNNWIFLTNKNMRETVSPVWIWLLGGPSDLSTRAMLDLTVSEHLEAAKLLELHIRWALGHVPRYYRSLPIPCLASPPDSGLPTHAPPAPVFSAWNSTVPLCCRDPHCAKP